MLEIKKYHDEILKAIHKKLSPKELQRRRLGWFLQYGDNSDVYLTELTLACALLETTQIALNVAMEQLSQERQLSDTGVRLLQHLEKFAKTGKKISDRARKNHELKYGTKAERMAVYEEYQIAVDEMHNRMPALSYADIKRRIGKQFQVSSRTIQRYTINPKTKK